MIRRGEVILVVMLMVVVVVVVFLVSEVEVEYAAIHLKRGLGSVFVLIPRRRLLQTLMIMRVIMG